MIDSPASNGSPVDFTSSSCDAKRWPLGLACAHRVTCKPTGMLERFNVSIGEVLYQTCCASSAQLQAKIMSYVKAYNHPLAQCESRTTNIN